MSFIKQLAVNVDRFQEHLAAAEGALQETEKNLADDAPRGSWCRPMQRAVEHVLAATREVKLGITNAYGNQETIRQALGNEESPLLEWLELLRRSLRGHHDGQQRLPQVETETATFARQIAGCLTGEAATLAEQVVADVERRAWWSAQCNVERLIQIREESKIPMSEIPNPLPPPVPLDKDVVIETMTDEAVTRAERYQRLGHRIHVVDGITYVEHEGKYRQAIAMSLGGALQLRGSTLTKLPTTDSK